MGIHFSIVSSKQKGQLLPCGMSWPAPKQVSQKGLLSNRPTGYLNIEGLRPRSPSKSEIPSLSLYFTPDLPLP